MKKSKVCSIIVTHNGESVIQKCISSLSAQTQKTDIVVIDNYSTDKTLKILKRNNIKKIITCNSNYGFGKANNIGFEYVLSEGYPYILLVNQDVFLEVNVVDELINSFRKNHGIISTIHLDKSGKHFDEYFSNYINKKSGRILIEDFLLRRKIQTFYKLDFINAALWMLKREVVITVGGFNPMFLHYGEDNDYVNRLHKHNFSIGINPNLRIIHFRDNPRSKRKAFNNRELKNRLYVNYLINLLDVNYNFTESFLKVFRNISIEIIRNIFKFNLSKTLIFIEILLKIIKNIYHLKSKHNEALNEITPFLNYIK